MQTQLRAQRITLCEILISHYILDYGVHVLVRRYCIYGVVPYGTQYRYVYNVTLDYAELRYESTVLVL